jgi:hypothetical protein
MVEKEIYLCQVTINAQKMGSRLLLLFFLIVRRITYATTTAHGVVVRPPPARHLYRFEKR